MGFLNKLFGFRWSLYIVQNGNQLAYAMHEHSVIRLTSQAFRCSRCLWTDIWALTVSPLSHRCTGRAKKGRARELIRLANMKTAEVIDMFRSAIANTRQAGATQVTLDDLDAYANRLEDAARMSPNDVAAGEAAMETYKADLAEWIGARQRYHEHNLEMMRATISTGQSALKNALLINGGAAAAAVLAFIGGIWSVEKSQAVIGAIAAALYCYVMGVLSAAIASGATYWAQAGYGGEFGKASRTIARIGHVIAVLGVLASYGLFGRASWLAFTGVNVG